jgi:hypothetical protein
VFSPAAARENLFVSMGQPKQVHLKMAFLGHSLVALSAPGMAM